MDSIGIMQRIADFDAKHGASVCRDGWIYFEDGAARETNPLGPMMGVPTDPRRAAQRKLTYAETVLEQRVAAFDKRRLYFSRAAQVALKQRHTPPPPASAEAAEAELRGLQHDVKIAQRAVAKAQAEVERLAPEAVRERERQAADNRRANEKLLVKLNQIEI
jgi:hypothetical protein